jgi:hypothetical protein
MNATQPPLQHGQGQPHDLQQHQQPIMQYQPQQMRTHIPLAPAGPFPSGPQSALYPQPRQGPPPNQMMIGRPGMVVLNGIQPSAMVPAPIPFHNTIRRQPGYPPFTQNGPASNHPLAHPPMYRPVPGGELVCFNAISDRTVRRE